MQSGYNNFALKLMTEDQAPVELDQQRVTMGRSSTNVIRLLNKSVSRNHLLIEVFEDHVSVQDLNSSAGTFVNSELVPPFENRVAKLGDTIVIGECVCELVASSAPTVQPSDSEDGMRTIVW